MPPIITFADLKEKHKKIQNEVSDLIIYKNFLLKRIQDLEKDEDNLYDIIDNERCLACNYQRDMIKTLEYKITILRNEIEIVKIGCNTYEQTLAISKLKNFVEIVPSISSKIEENIICYRCSNKKLSNLKQFSNLKWKCINIKECFERVDKLDIIQPCFFCKKQNIDKHRIKMQNLACLVCIECMKC